MSKQERRRVRVAASLGLTVLMSSAILGGVAPLTANAAEVGSEPTTAEVSPMLTAPENPSNAVASLPEGDDPSAQVMEETPVPAEEEREEVLDAVPETNADPELAAQSENIEVDSGQTTEQASSTDESTDDAILLDEDDISDGYWGDVYWTFEDGVLSLSGGTGLSTTDGVSPWKSIASQVTKVEIAGQIIAPSILYNLFDNFSAVTSFEGLSNMDTSNVTGMWNIFRGTSSLESIDLSSWDVSKVDDVENMFYGSGLNSLDLSTWQITDPYYASNAFGSMPNLEFLNISSWSSLNKMDLFGENVQNLATVVLGTETRLTNLNAGPDFMWRGENTDFTFYSNYTGGNADTYHRVPVETEGKWGSVSWVIENNTLYLSGGEGTSIVGDTPWAPFETAINSVVIEDSIIAPEKIGGLFADLEGVTSYEGLEKLNVSKTTDMSGLFANNSNVTTLDLSNWDTSNVTNMSGMFTNNWNVTAYDLSNWDTGNVTDMNGMFASNSKVTVFDLSNWDTSNVTNMSSMFNYNVNATVYDLSNWDTGNVTNMNGMFAGNWSVTAYDLSNWDTSNVTNMSRMFSYNQELTELDLSNWDTSSVISMSSQFYYCTNLSQLGIESWNVGKLEDISSFLEGTKLESLDLSKWKFSGYDAYRAFASMSELQNIDISGFDLRMTNTYQTLGASPKLEEITLGENSKLSRSLDEVSGKVWNGDVTGHQFGLVYNGGFPDTYRLIEGIVVHHEIQFLDSQTGYEMGGGILYGRPGEIVPLSQLTLPTGYELPDPDATIQLSETGETWTRGELHLNRVVMTTTRTIQFQGLPEGHLEDKVQEIKWHWDWNEDDMDPLSRNVRFYEGVVYTAQGGYDELLVPKVEGYEADIAVVAAKSFDAALGDLPEDETVTVTYTKLDTGDGGDQNPDPNPSQPDPDNGGSSGGSTGTGSTGTGSVGGGQLTNLSTGGSSTTDPNQALPQTGSQVASGLTLLGLGLLGLLGFTKRRKRS